jgi:hypothetical protein
MLPRFCVGCSRQKRWPTSFGAATRIALHHASRLPQFTVHGLRLFGSEMTMSKKCCRMIWRRSIVATKLHRSKLFEDDALHAAHAGIGVDNTIRKANEKAV